MARSMIYEILASPASSDSTPVTIGVFKRALEELMLGMNGTPAPLTPPAGIQG